MLVKRLFFTLGLLSVGLPYVGPSIFGLGVKPLWIFFFIIPVLFWGKASLGQVVFILLGLILEITRYFTWPMESFYGVMLWGIVIVFMFSTDLVDKINITDKQLVRFQKIFYGLFFALYTFNYLNSSLYYRFIEIIVGQSRNLGRSDFSFLSPEPGLGAFSVLTVAFVIFHFSKEKSYWQLIIPCVCLIMIGSATSFGLTLLWIFYFYSNISLRAPSHIFIIMLAVGVAYFTVNYLITGLALARFEALWYFDINGTSSVSIRAREILKLANFGFISGTSSSPVGIVKASTHAPVFVVTLFILFLSRCKVSSSLLILPSLIFIPVTHPFLWVVLGLSKFKRP